MACNSSRVKEETATLVVEATDKCIKGAYYFQTINQRGG